MYSVVARSCNLAAVERQKVLNILCVSLWPQLPSMQRPGVKLSSVACPALQSFPHYLTRGTTVGGGDILNAKCVFWFSLQLLSEAFPILRRNQHDVIITVYRYSCKVTIILVRL